MAEGKGDLEALIRLRKQRPTFSRMVSWEFNQSPKPTKKTRRKKKQVSQDGSGEEKTDVDNIDDDKTGIDNEIDEESVRGETNSEESSEYDTAPEDDSDMHELTESLESSWRSSELSDSLANSFRTVVSSSTFDTFDIDEELTDENSVSEDEEECAGDKSSVGGLHPGRRRRLSKRQKRKRSEKHRVTYANELYNLGRLFDTTDDIDDVFNEVQESPANMTVQRRIPTLSELCMLATRRKPKSNSEKIKAPVKIDLPPGMKQLFVHWGTSHRMLSEQLSFLQNHILPLICDKEKILRNTLYHGYGSTTSVEIPLRCVWSALPFPGSFVGSLNPSYRTRRIAAFIFTPSFHLPKEQDNFSDYDESQYMSQYRVSVVSCLSAFASAVDLMLPGSVFTSRRRHDSGSEADMLSQMRKTMLVRVKMALKLRYPDLVEKFFQLVLPYVMWARGNITMATDLFRALCTKESPFSFSMPDGRRAAFLVEIGHMHQMFGDTHTAELFYKQAGETALEESKAVDQDIKEVTEQTQVLLASTHDTGLLTSEKALQSSTVWNGAVNLPNSFSHTAMSGLVSFLCYHAAHWTGSDWKTEALSKIQKYEKTNKSVLYYKGMLHAIDGNERESKLAYLEFKHSTYNTSLSEFEHLGGKTKNPWLPLVNLVTRAPSPVLPMNVVWRTQLQPMSITDERPMEAQVNSVDLNLRLSESGHVTGDMQMLLPPMREILLDPYTGQLVLNNIPGHTTYWKSAFFDSQQLQTHGLFMPIPVLLHQWEDGSSVHLVKPTNDSICQEYDDQCPSCPAMLYWRTASGQGAKLNVHTEVKNYFRKIALDSLKSSETKSWTNEKTELMAHFIQLAYNKNLSMNIQHLSYPVDKFIAARKRRNEKAEKSEKKTNRKKEDEKKKLRSGKHFNWSKKVYSLIFIQEPIICGKTVVLHFDIPGERKIAMYIPTTDKTRLMKPVIWETVSSTRFLKSDANSQFIAMCDTRQKKVMFCNTDGVYIQTIDISVPVGMEDTIHENILTIGPNVFGIAHEGTSVWKHMVGLELEDGGLETNITWSLAPYWSELGEENGLKKIKSVCAVGQELGDDGTLLLVHMSVGVAWIDPNSLEVVPIEETQECRDRYTSAFSSDGKVLATKFKNMTVLSQKLITTDDDGTWCRVALGCDNEVIIVELQQCAGMVAKETRVVLTTRLSLPGTVKELHYVGKGDFLVTFTHFSGAEAYNEHLLHFKLNGSLCEVLMGLGRGPRSFHSVYLHGNGGEGQAGWYVYMRDGHNGIIGVKLNK